MKKVLIGFIFLASLSAFAEHNATYCGKLIESDSQDYIAKLKVPYQQIVGDVWEDQYEERFSYATIYHVDGGSTSERNLNKFLESTRRNTIICVKGRWGGSLYNSNLSTDNVYRIDYKSRFEDTE